MNKKETCDTCGKTCTNREDLVKHIVDNHTNVGIRQQQQLAGYSGRVQQQGGQQGGPQAVPQGGPQGVMQGGPQRVLQGGLQGWPGLPQGGSQGGLQGGTQGELLPRFKCQGCRYETNSQHELKYHEGTMHQQTGRICKRCNIKIDENNTMENHMCRLPGDDPENTCNFCKNQFHSREEKTKHICQHHRFKTVEQQRREKSRANTECNNGADCWRAKRSMCWFKHSQPINASSHMGQRKGQDGAGASLQLYCRYQERCYKGEQFCKFKHFNQGFLLNNPEQTHQ